MKIGLVCPYDIFLGSGVKEVVMALAHGLRERGHDVKIISAMPVDKKEVVIDDPNVIMLGALTSIRTPLHTVAQVSVSVSTEAVQAMLDEEKFDILNFHEPWVPMLSRQILSRSKTVNVATFHAKLPETTMSRTLEKVITPYTRSILKYLHSMSAVSEAAKEYVSSLTDRSVEIVPNGIDLKTYVAPAQKKPLNKDRKTILYIGRLEKRKGAIFLIDAYHELTERRKDVQLIIAGAGPDREKLEDYVKENGIPHVTFKGYIDDKDKKHLLGNADLYCSPALFGESFGIVLLEAMAMGAVTVAGDNPGYSSVMKDRGTWSLVNPRDIPEFSRRLEMMLFDEEMRELWTKWAQEYVKQFDWPKVVAQYEAFYERALANHRSGK
jgi:phosphatidylinositol alpha-mannosyltransferase